MNLLRELYTFTDTIWEDSECEIVATINEGIATISFGDRASSQKITNKATRGNKLFKKHARLGILIHSIRMLL